MIIYLLLVLTLYSLVQNQKTKTTSIKGIDVKLQIVNLLINIQWDTAGQERFSTIAKSFVNKAQGIIVVYDVTNEKSFKAVNNWIQQIEQIVSKDTPKVLIGNKADLNDARVVEQNKGMILAKKYGMPFYETSAKNGLNVERVFEKMAEEIMNTRDIYVGGSSSIIGDLRVTRKKKCC